MYIQAFRCHLGRQPAYLCRGGKEPAERGLFQRSFASILGGQVATESCGQFLRNIQTIVVPHRIK